MIVIQNKYLFSILDIFSSDISRGMLVSYLRGFLLRNTSLLKMSTSGSSAFPKPIEGSIREKLTKDFTPYHLEIINESYMHSVPKGSETHFKVVIVSDKFDKLSLIQVYTLRYHSLISEISL